ncbi:MAG: porin, partial [Duncaniella sp.]|nr:porin [Duncaniella sp.]
MRKIFFALCAACVAFAHADEPATDTLLKFQAEASLDYQRDWNDGKTVKDNSGFEGKYINIQADGNITDALSYSWRQRLNKTHKDASFFDATDWIYLN